MLPELQVRAGDFGALREAMKDGLDAAGARFGHRERVESAPWNFVTGLNGHIVSVETESSAGKIGIGIGIGINVDGDGEADKMVQIGPILRGTAPRDSLPFISFTA